ncbi:hypothetical protein K402DRAFT_116535 [Aulographum hederae CBS 113979]|uniref:Uncharacterized protein n=1 Tax=Aulographum hederae CBS 113979 TaxID=1176131 RepID=A0A6G1GVN8_9PEZI|nr:hypothetical protein K402DRAFT_116535 [Aulographum hederae CBS 113979]
MRIPQSPSPIRLWWSHQRLRDFLSSTRIRPSCDLHAAMHACFGPHNFATVQRPCHIDFCSLHRKACCLPRSLLARRVSHSAKPDVSSQPDSTALSPSKQPTSPPLEVPIPRISWPWTGSQQASSFDHRHRRPTTTVADVSRSPAPREVQRPDSRYRETTAPPRRMMETAQAALWGGCN